MTNRLAFLFRLADATYNLNRREFTVGEWDESLRFLRPCAVVGEEALWSKCFRIAPVGGVVEDGPERSDDDAATRDDVLANLHVCGGTAPKKRKCNGRHSKFNTVGCTWKEHVQRGGFHNHGRNTRFAGTSIFQRTLLICRALDVAIRRNCERKCYIQAC